MDCSRLIKYLFTENKYDKRRHYKWENIMERHKNEFHAKLSVGVKGETIHYVEKRLDVILPDSYKRFLASYGNGGIYGIDILGAEAGKVPRVVKMTEFYRFHGMPRELIVIIDDLRYQICLQTSRFHDGECPVVKWGSKDDNIEFVEESFVVYLTNMLVEWEEMVTNTDRLREVIEQVLVGLESGYTRKELSEGGLGLIYRRYSKAKAVLEGRKDLFYLNMLIGGGRVYLDVGKEIGDDISTNIWKTERVIEYMNLQITELEREKLYNMLIDEIGEKAVDEMRLRKGIDLI